MIENATRLACRRATYSVRREFHTVLRLVAQALDSQLGTQLHSRALVAQQFPAR